MSSFRLLGDSVRDYHVVPRYSSRAVTGGSKVEYGEPTSTAGAPQY